MVRGDRYYTTDFTRKLPMIPWLKHWVLNVPYELKAMNLTAWGYHDCQRHRDNGGFGGESAFEFAVFFVSFSCELNAKLHDRSA